MGPPSRVLLKLVLLDNRELLDEVEFCVEEMELLREPDKLVLSKIELVEMECNKIERDKDVEELLLAPDDELWLDLLVRLEPGKLEVRELNTGELKRQHLGTKRAANIATFHG